jgi:hypothetical protein
MKMMNRLLVYIILVTWVFAKMDWDPIHQSYLKYNDWPHSSVQTWWGKWSSVKDITGKIFCPPCKVLAEPYFFVLFEVEASPREQDDLCKKHAPDCKIFASGFWWGQGGEDNSNPWKFVSWPAWLLYWLPYTIIWWIFVKDFFYLRRPWWYPRLKEI